MEKQSYSLIQAIFSSGIIVLVSGGSNLKRGEKIKLKRHANKLASSLHNGHTANTKKGLAVISDCQFSSQRPICSFMTNKQTKNKMNSTEGKILYLIATLMAFSFSCFRTLGQCDFIIKKLWLFYEKMAGCRKYFLCWLRLHKRCHRVYVQSIPHHLFLYLMMLHYIVCAPTFPSTSRAQFHPFFMLRIKSLFPSSHISNLTFRDSEVFSYEGILKSSEPVYLFQLAVNRKTYIWKYKIRS